MLELFIIRHAKSGWDDPMLSDFDRPLNDRGKKDAPVMGGWLKENGIKPDLIVASPAKRAKKTARVIAESLGYAKDAIVLDESIYEASLESLAYLVCALPSDKSCVFLVGHNPGVTELANLYGDIAVENISTCGIVGISFDAKAWRDVCGNKGHVIVQSAPKKVAEQV